MARAPARLAPPIKVWLRSFAKASATLCSSQNSASQKGGLQSGEKVPPKTEGHHPDLDDGPNFSEIFATPSPGFVVDYNDLGNSYDASNAGNRTRFTALLRHHGAASHSLVDTSRCETAACSAM
jgi:hypothetical protein